MSYPSLEKTFAGSRRLAAACARRLYQVSVPAAEDAMRGG